MSTLQLHRPAVLGPDPQRLRVQAPECAQQPSVVLDAVASDVTTRSTLKKYRGSTRHVRAGIMECNIMHETDGNWPMALRLEEGSRYQVEAFECITRAKKHDELPLDARTDDGLVFYSFAREIKPSRDEADGRQWRRGYVSIWTDGLMLTVSTTDPKQQLEAGKAYKIVVKKLAGQGLPVTH